MTEVIDRAGAFTLDAAPVLAAEGADELPLLLPATAATDEDTDEDTDDETEDET